MTKKQNTKKKVSIKLVEGQSVVVLDYHTLLDIATMYDSLGAKEPQRSRDFYDIADSIRIQASENHYLEDEEYDW